MRTGRRSCRVYEQFMNVRFKLPLFLNQLTFVILCIDGPKLRVSLWVKQRYLCPELLINSHWVEQEASPNLTPNCLIAVLAAISLPSFKALPRSDFPAESTWHANPTPGGQGHTYLLKTGEGRSGLLFSKGDLSRHTCLQSQNARWPQGPYFHLHPWKNLINLSILAAEQHFLKRKINVNFQR